MQDIPKKRGRKKSGIETTVMRVPVALVTEIKKIILNFKGAKHD